MVQVMKDGILIFTTNGVQKIQQKDGAHYNLISVSNPNRKSEATEKVSKPFIQNHFAIFEWK